MVCATYGLNFHNVDLSLHPLCLSGTPHLHGATEDTCLVLSPSLELYPLASGPVGRLDLPLMAWTMFSGSMSA